MLHQETKEFVHHNSKDEIIKHFVISDFLVSHNVTTEIDQIECSKDVVIDNFL